ncbi:MAG: acetyl-CoA carboxylase biotin carboxyl carrier protein [Candidatus Aureabacteria bacterium]|nr:acetyl-CoA carboxylase biotin carboxyl carrier protein [Candidatus Auribacterota bacterium]
MNIKEIEKIIELMNANGIMEFTLEKEGVKICLKKTGSVPVAIHDYIHQQIPPYHQVQEKAEQKPGSPQVSVEETGVDYICSPIVGTFYRAPAPDADPYVKTGQNIEVGQVVCIVEAMKVMNEIKSDFAGVIEEVIVENGDPVEFGQKMFKIRKK